MDVATAWKYVTDAYKAQYPNHTFEQYRDGCKYLVDAIFAAVKDTAAARDKDVADRDAVIRAQNSTITHRNELCAEKDALIWQQEDELDRRAETIAQLRSEINARDTEIARLTMALDYNERAALRAQSAGPLFSSRLLKEKDRIILAKHELIVQQGLEIKALSATLRLADAPDEPNGFMVKMKTRVGDNFNSIIKTYKDTLAKASAAAHEWLELNPTDEFQVWQRVAVWRKMDATKAPSQNMKAEPYIRTFADAIDFVNRADTRRWASDAAATPPAATMASNPFTSRFAIGQRVRVDAFTPPVSGVVKAVEFDASKVRYHVALDECCGGGVILTADSDEVSAGVETRKVAVALTKGQMPTCFASPFALGQKVVVDITKPPEIGEITAIQFARGDDPLNSKKMYSIVGERSSHYGVGPEHLTAVRDDIVNIRVGDRVFFTTPKGSHNAIVRAVPCHNVRGYSVTEDYGPRYVYGWEIDGYVRTAT